MSRLISKTALAALALAAAFLLSPLTATPALSASLAPEATTNLVPIAQKAQRLRTIAPGRAKLVPQSQRLAVAQRDSGVTCCTTFNSSTGGDGCATFPDSCPANQFQMDCGTNGCW